MFVLISLAISILILALTAGYLFQQSGEEYFFSGIMAVAGAVVMLLTLLLYPLTRRKSRS
ncbi:MAG: hypothetical protein ACREP9_21780 [Candidatus Dormibacteraceae bacterium]